MKVSSDLFVGENLNYKQKEGHPPVEHLLSNKKGLQNRRKHIVFFNMYLCTIYNTFSFRDLSDIPYELEVRSMKMIMSKRPTDAGYAALRRGHQYLKS